MVGSQQTKEAKYTYSVLGFLAEMNIEKSLDTAVAVIPRFHY
jgi:hypothetical protein